MATAAIFFDLGSTPAGNVKPNRPSMLLKVWPGKFVFIPRFVQANDQAIAYQLVITDTLNRGDVFNTFSGNWGA